MTDETRSGEVHVELLLGTRVRDVHGDVVGRLEELRCEKLDGEDVVVEFHVGAAAMIERIAMFVSSLPLLDRLPWSWWEYRVRWQDVELVSSRELRLRVPKDALERVRPDAPPTPVSRLKDRAPG